MAAADPWRVAALVSTGAEHASATERVAEVGAEWTPERRHEQRLVRRRVHLRLLSCAVGKPFSYTMYGLAAVPRTARPPVP